jgi:hypothetical protein
MWYGILRHCEISYYNIVPRFVSHRNVASRPILSCPIFNYHGITWIKFQELMHVASAFSKPDLKAAILGKRRFLYIYF